MQTRMHTVEIREAKGGKNGSPALFSLVLERIPERDGEVGSRIVLSAGHESRQIAHEDSDARLKGNQILARGENGWQAALEAQK